MSRILELLVGLGRRVVFMPLNNAAGGGGEDGTSGFTGRSWWSWLGPGAGGRPHPCRPGLGAGVSVGSRQLALV